MVLSDALVGPGRLFTGVRAVASTGSTNADLAAEARAGAPSGTVLIADHQSTGRGRFTRRWEASPGASVAVSVLLRAGDVPVARWPWLPLVTGVAVADGLRAAAGIEAAVKWPNDVLIDDRKVCGILAERVDDAAVIGMGINTTLTEDELPVATATSLALAGSQASTTEVVLGVLTELEQAFRRWVEGADLRRGSSSTAQPSAGRFACCSRPRSQWRDSPWESTNGDACASAPRRASAPLRRGTCSTCAENPAGPACRDPGGDGRERASSSGSACG